MTCAEFAATAPDMLSSIQDKLYDSALKFRNSNTVQINTLDDFRDFFSSEDGSGFAQCHSSAEPEDLDGIIDILKGMQVTSRCIPMHRKKSGGICIFTGKPTTQQVIYAKAY